MSTNSRAPAAAPSHSATSLTGRSGAGSPAVVPQPASQLHDRDRLLRIQEAAEKVGLTARAIRHYEEMGLLQPAARSRCAYRLYDEDDLERLRYIRAMRDDAGFSLAEIGRMLEDEQARTLAREQIAAVRDPAERSAIHRASLARLDRQIATLRQKAERLEAMIAGVEVRRRRVEERISELQIEEAASSADSAGTAPADPGQSTGSRSGRPPRATGARA